MNDTRVRVWDVPTRLFHWTLLLFVVLQFASGEFGWLDLRWHLYTGYATLALLLFRVTWGLVGSDSARFASFLRGPMATWRYLRGGERVNRTHNPLGGWGVVLMLVLLLAIALTGLASSDDIDVFGPLAAHLDEATVRSATRWHHRLTAVLPWLIGLHVLAVLVHEWRGERLIAAMWHGRRDGLGVAPRIASTALAVTVLAISALAIGLMVWIAGD